MYLPEVFIVLWLPFVNVENIPYFHFLHSRLKNRLSNYDGSASAEILFTILASRNSTSDTVASTTDSASATSSGIQPATMDTTFFEDASTNEVTNEGNSAAVFGIPKTAFSTTPHLNQASSVNVTVSTEFVPKQPHAEYSETSGPDRLASSPGSRMTRSTRKCLRDSVIRPLIKPGTRCLSTFCSS